MPEPTMSVCQFEDSIQRWERENRPPAATEAHHAHLLGPGSMPAQEVCFIDEIKCWKTGQGQTDMLGMSPNTEGEETEHIDMP